MIQPNPPDTSQLSAPVLAHAGLCAAAGSNEAKANPSASAPTAPTAPIAARNMKNPPQTHGSRDTSGPPWPRPEPQTSLGHNCVQVASFAARLGTNAPPPVILG